MHWTLIPLGEEVGMKRAQDKSEWEEEVRNIPEVMGGAKRFSRKARYREVRLPNIDRRSEAAVISAFRCRRGLHTREATWSQRPLVRRCLLEQV